MVEQVDFYVLENMGLADRSRYACRIAQKAYLSGLKVFVNTAPGQNTEIDELLWTFSQGSFVPHTLAERASGNWQDFPVQVGTGPEGHEGADLLINLERDVPRQYAAFPRVADMVTNDPEDKAAGRERFRFYREQGIEPVTHKIA